MLSSWNPGPCLLFPLVTWAPGTPREEEGTVQFGWLFLPWPHLPPAEQALCRDREEASIALWWQFLDPQVTVPCRVLAQVFLKQLLSIFGVQCPEVGVKEVAVRRKGKASCLWCSELDRVSRPHPSPECPHLHLGTGLPWGLTAACLEWGSASLPAQTPLITHCPDSRDNTRALSAFEGDAIRGAHGYECGHTSLGVPPGREGLGAEGPFPVLSLRCTGGSPGSCSGWGDLAVQAPCRYSLINSGVSKEPGPQGPEGWGPVQCSRALGVGAVSPASASSWAGCVSWLRFA